MSRTQPINNRTTSSELMQVTQPQSRLTEQQRSRLNNNSATQDDLAALKSALLNTLTKVETDLIFIDYNDQLSNQQIDMLLAGDRDEVEEDLTMQWAGEQRFVRAKELAQEKTEELGISFDNLNYLQQLDLIDQIQSQDSSDPLSQLERNTGAVLLRHTVVPASIWYDADPELLQQAHYSVYLHDESGPARVKIIEDALIKNGTLTGPLSQTDRNNLTLMVNNGPEYLHEAVSLDAIWYGPLSDVTLDCNKSDRTVRAEAGINLVLIDTWNGSGFDVQIEAPVSMTFSQDNHAQLDVTYPGYGSWDRIAGPAHSAYRTELTEAIKQEQLGTDNER